MSEKSQSYIKVKQCGSVLEICMNRPDKKNALNMAMYQGLVDAIDLGVASSEVRVIVLSGAGGCFTSGNDLAVFANPSELGSRDNPIFQFMKTLTHCPKPVIAAVEGVAIGIGTTMLLHCDLVVTCPEAEFKLPFVSLGLAPEYGSSWLLPRIVGHAKASEWLLLGSSIGASEALNAGFVNRISEQPLVLAQELADKIAQMPPKAVQEAKALLRDPLKDTVDEVIENEAKVFVSALKGPEFSEAVTAFFEKRKPDFSNS